MKLGGVRQRFWQCSKGGVLYEGMVNAEPHTEEGYQPRISESKKSGKADKAGVY